MPKSFAGFLAQAQRDWEAGRALDAGRVLYEHMPVGQRPPWAAQVLEFVKDLVPKTPEIERVLAIAKDRARWREAYEAFQAIRRLLPEAKDPLVESVLALAEKVAKVTYIASGAPAPFERNAGWRVAGDLRAVLARAGDKAAKLEEEAWAVLSGQER
jgi:hypothetical protein